MFSKKNKSINNNEKIENIFSFYNKQGKKRIRQISSSNSLINNKNNDYNSSNSTQQSLLNENKKEKIKKNVTIGDINVINVPSYKKYNKKGFNLILENEENNNYNCNGCKCF